MQRFGEKLSSLRKQQGMTVRELAGALGYASHGYISLIENGKIKPRAEFIWKVAQLFNVTTDQLIRDDLDVVAPPQPDTTIAKEYEDRQEPGA
jgi:transcriptional regulator with XRE-family HTH domain